MLNYYLFLILISIIFSQSCQEGKNHCSRCNPITKLCVKCDKEIYIPDGNGGCENSKKCILGKNNCFECTEEGNLCKVCEEGYFPDENGGCSYTYNCEVSFQGKCLNCKKGYILIGNNQYLTDPLSICKSINSDDLNNCEKINTVQGTCQECKEGYFLNKGDKKCTNIENCYESTFGICDKCLEGYCLDKTSNKCIEQNENLKYCKEAFNKNNCNICDDNYFFDEKGKCVENKFCSKSNNGFCTQCISGYFLTEKKNACTKTEKNCYSGKKDLGICEKCKDNYYLDYEDEKCKLNKEDNNFKYCLIADGKCNKCIDGYFLGEDKKCSLTKNCAESNLGICNICIDNYYLGLDNKCNNVEYCIFTSKYSDECEECKDNYYYNKNNQKYINSEGKFKNCKYGYDDLYCLRCKNDFYLNLTDNLCYNNNITGNFYKMHGL